MVRTAEIIVTGPSFCGVCVPCSLLSCLSSIWCLGWGDVSGASGCTHVYFQRGETPTDTTRQCAGTDAPDLRLVIRDDGSTDRTREILGDYARRCANVQVTFGANIGVVSSFFEVLRNAPDADYFSFCDQDDFGDRIR